MALGHHRLVQRCAGPHHSYRELHVSHFELTAHLGQHFSSGPSVVEVWCDNRWVGVGAYVGGGFIVTKASELGREVSVFDNDDVNDARLSPRSYCLLAGE
jgi:hypothetical protein